MDKQAVKDKEEKIKEDTEKYFESLMENLDDPKTQEKLDSYFQFIAQFHNYSPRNVAVICAQYIDRVEKGLDPQPIQAFAGYNQWAKMKGDEGERCHVKKGEKGYVIYRPNIFKQWQKDESGKYILDSNRKKIPELDENGRQKTITRFALTSVFDVNQTNAREIGAWQSLTYRNVGEDYSQEFFDKVVTQVEEVTGFNVSIEPIGRPGVKGYCSFSDRKIAVLDSISINEKLGTLFHEAGHALMHDPSIEPEKGTDYDILHKESPEREAEAECFSYICAQTLGIQQDSQLYISGWKEQSKEYLQETMPFLLGKVKKFIKETAIKDMAAEYKYVKDYPVHAEIYQGSDLSNSEYSLDALSMADGRGYTPAMAAVSVENQGAVDFLKNAGVEFSAKNQYGISAEDLEINESKRLPPPTMSL